MPAKAELWLEVLDNNIKHLREKYSNVIMLSNDSLTSSIYDEIETWSIVTEINFIIDRADSSHAEFRFESAEEATMFKMSFGGKFYAHEVDEKSS